MNSIAIANPAINVPFYGANLFVVNHNNEPYTPMKPIVEGMGMDWKSQFIKIKQRFAKGMVEITIPTKGGKQTMICLPLRKLAGWLQTISPNKVKPEIRDKVIQYQNECDDVLYEYWTTGEVKKKTRRNQRQPERTKTPDYRYNISLSYRDNVTGLEERFSGVCNTHEEIIQGTAKKFGIFIPEMINMPFNAY